MTSIQIAAGILIAALVLQTLRMGMEIYRANLGWRGYFGALMFFAGLVAWFLVVIRGFNAG